MIMILQAQSTFNLTGIGGPGSVVTAREYEQRFNLLQSLIYIFGGLAVCLVCDSFYGNVGMGGCYLPVWVRKSLPIAYLRAAVSLPASIYLWTGCYDLMSWFVLDDFIWWDVALISVGMIMMEMLGTLSCFAYIYPEEEERDEIPCPDETSGWRMQLLHGTRAFLTINAQTAVWVGAYDLMENYGESTIFRECFFSMARARL